MNNLLVLLMVLLFAFVSPLYSGFQPLNTQTSMDLYDMCFTDSNTGYAVGHWGTVIKTTNGGDSWFLLETNVSNVFHSVYFLNQQTGWAVGGNGGIIKTTNAGLNWLFHYLSEFNFFSVYFLNAQTGWAIGRFSECLKSTDGGANWFSQVIPLMSGGLQSIIFNNGKGYIGANQSLTNLFTTTNEGVNWVNNKIGPGVGNTSIYDISFADFFGIAVGGDSNSASPAPLIFITTDNGSSWDEKIIPNKKAIFYAVDICPINTNIIYCVGQYHLDPIHGSRGLIMYSTNKGVTWLEESWPTDSTAFEDVKITPNAVYIAGTKGLILKSELPVGITPVGSVVPKAYVLSQNYPNPFNPTTNIEFSIPKNGIVKLSVFDIMGREVTTLVDQALTVGHYKVDFNGSNLSSGTYFYKLSSGDYSAVKKLVLMK